MRPPHASSGAHPDEETATVGPWTISSSYKADEGCAMSRSTEGMDVTFLRTRDSLLLFLRSQKWNLEHGKAYTVRLMVGSRSVEAKALAESKAVMIALADHSLNEMLSRAAVLEVRGEGATLRVPLEGSTAALARLDACFSRAGIDAEPFVSPTNCPKRDMRRARDRRRWGVNFLPVNWDRCHVHANYTVSSRGMMGVSLCEANRGTRERVCCPSEQGPSVWLRTRACPDARSSGKLVAMIALRLSPV